MLRAVGLSDEDFTKAQIGVAAAANDVTPCNMGLADLAGTVRRGVVDAGGVALGFSTLAVSDGISMGHEGMRASLPSRDLIADSVECMALAQRFDGLVTLAGCDKSLPAMLMAAARLNVPPVFVYGGSSLPWRSTTSTGSVGAPRTSVTCAPEAGTSWSTWTASVGCQW